MRRNGVVYALFVAFVLCGCSIVASKGPIGEAPVVLNAKDWNGTWFNPGGDYCMMKVKNENEGIVRLAWIEDDKEMKHKSSDVFIRKSGKWLFASMKEDDDQDTANGLYVWAIIKKGQKTLFIWLPNEERFRKLVEAKTFPGEAKESAGMLGDLKPEHMKIITTDERRSLFDWEDPLVLIKLSD